MAVECIETTKTYTLGIKNVSTAWAWQTNAWRKLTREDYGSVWYEDYSMGVASTSNLLENWCEYLPGVKSTCDHDDFTIEFDMLDVTAAMDEVRLVYILETMAHAVNRRRVLPAIARPWQGVVVNNYGDRVRHVRGVWRHPALKPLANMLTRDYPAEIKPDGNRRP